VNALQSFGMSGITASHPRRLESIYTFVQCGRIWASEFCFSGMLSCPGPYIGNCVFTKAQGLLKFILKAVKDFFVVFKILGHTQPDIHVIV
jgi:hypothetical protein